MAGGKNHAQPRSEIETLAVVEAVLNAAVTEEIQAQAAEAVVALVVYAIGYKQKLKKQ